MKWLDFLKINTELTVSENTTLIKVKKPSKKEK
jgi:hypothetical protein